MTIRQPQQRRLKLLDQGKRSVRTQFGALCWRRRRGDVEFLLVTSRRQNRWIIPKGWPADDATPTASAEREAWEEAGVEGKIQPQCLGIYSYQKSGPAEEALPCVVAVFPLKVKKLLPEFPEANERRPKWFSRKKAAKSVDEPELRTIIEKFDPALV